MDNQKLKIAALICLATLAVGFAFYRFFGLSNEIKIEDKDALTAAKWLRMADEGNFKECRKSAEAPEKWFKLFKANRESLEKLNSRQLKSKTAVPKSKVKIYKIIFNSSFKNAPKIYETVWIGQDGKIWRQRYDYLRLPNPSWRSRDFGTASEIAGVRSATAEAIGAMKSLDVEFFDQITLRNERFRFGKRIIKRIKAEREKCGTSYKCSIGKRIVFSRKIPGKTELDSARAIINCFYKIKGNTYCRSIPLILHRDKTAISSRWNIYRFYYGRLRKHKERNARKK